MATRKTDWRRALRALRTLLADPERTEQVFELTHALSGPSGDRLHARFLRHPEGRRLLAERPALLPLLQDRAALAAMPEGSLGRAYLRFMQEADLDADSLVGASMMAPRDEDDPDRRWIFDRLRDTHDLYHVLTGYGRDHAGEAANLAFTHAQTLDRGVGLILIAAAWKGGEGNRFGWPRYMWQAWRRGRRTAWLLVARFEELLPLPLATVRALLHLPSVEESHPGGMIVGNLEGVPPPPTSGMAAPASPRAA